MVRRGFFSVCLAALGFGEHGRRRNGRLVQMGDFLPNGTQVTSFTAEVNEDGTILNMSYQLTVTDYSALANVEGSSAIPQLTQRSSVPASEFPV